MNMADDVMRRFYRRANGHAERLPWHRTDPGRMLQGAVERATAKCRALDVGCGSGVFSAWLAARGMTVTGIDIFPEAIAMARTQVGDANVELVCTDLFAYPPSVPFDLVFDSGCLHSLVGGNVPGYKRQLLTWLAPGGDYVLGHWGRRHRLDWRPIGPRRRSQAEIERIFAPELQLLDTEVVEGKVPLPFGPTVRAVGYLFHRPRR